jgi:hypothetical protein
MSTIEYIQPGQLDIVSVVGAQTTRILRLIQPALILSPTDYYNVTLSRETVAVAFPNTGYKIVYELDAILHHLDGGYHAKVVPNKYLHDVPSAA